jgi:hypothetical protein
MKKILTRKRASLAVVSVGAVASLTLLTGCPPAGNGFPYHTGVGTKIGWCMAHNC